MGQLVKFQAESATIGANDGLIHGVANSFKMSRDGNQITEEAGKGVIGKKVPLLMSHDWGSVPIGSATMTAVTDAGLLYEGRIYEDISENRAQIIEAINDGVYYVSVGLGVLALDDAGAVAEMDLYELSVTAIPADPNATITQQLKELKEMNDEKITEASATTDDLMTAISELSAKVDDVLKAVAPADEKPASDAPAPDSAPATQSLDELVKLVQGLDIQDPMTAFKINKAIANI